MQRYERFMKRLAAGDKILIDGATGTEIERRGVPMLDDAWNGGGALSHPEVLRTVHEEYLHQGAQIVISNTFATSRHALRDAGVERDFRALNHDGVALAIEARERTAMPQALVAGGISYWSWSGRHPALEDLRNNITEQARILGDAGADLLMLEMMIDLDRMTVTLDAARQAGLPVWAGLTCGPDKAGRMSLRNGDPLEDALKLLRSRGVPVVIIMHTEVQYIDACLDVLDAHWQGPVGVYAHSARFVDNKCVFDSAMSPEDYAAHAERWLARGVQIVGGCCGIGVGHIAALRPLVTCP